VYRDSFLGLFDEGHPLYPRDGSPANKDGMKFARDTSSIGGRESQGKSVSRAGQFRLNHNLLNNPSKLEPEQRDRTLSVMKRAQSLSSLATLVTSEKGTVFSVRLSPVRNERPDEEEENNVESISEIACNAMRTANMPCADITEEAWFENERNGSMDQNAFEYVQKQLFLGSEMAEERAKSTEYIGSGQKPPFFGTLEIIEEEDVALECSIDPIPAPALESLHPSGGNDSERAGAGTPTRDRVNTGHSRNSDFEFSPVRPRSSSAAPDSPSQSPRRLPPSSATVAAATENQTKPPAAASMLKAALTNTNPEHKHNNHKDSRRSKSKEKDSRPQAMLGARRVNESFFTSDSEAESEAGSDEEDDDVIPHIIPLDIPQRSRSGSVDEAAYDPATADATQLHTQQNAHTSTQNLSEDARMEVSINISPVKIDRPNSSRSFTPSRLSPIHAHSPRQSHSYGPHSPDSGGHLLALEGAALSDPDSSVYSDSAFHSAYQSSNPSPHGTPPPRAKHTEDYLVGAGLLSPTSSAGVAHVGGGEDSWGRPPKIGVSSGSNSHRLRLMFPHSPHNSAHNTANIAAAHSPSQSRTGSYNSRSYSKQSIEDILQHALVDRETESSAFAPTNSRFSFQSSSLSARLGGCSFFPRLCLRSTEHLNHTTTLTSPQAAWTARPCYYLTNQSMCKTTTTSPNPRTSLKRCTVALPAAVKEPPTRRDPLGLVVRQATGTTQASPRREL